MSRDTSRVRLRGPALSGFLALAAWAPGSGLPALAQHVNGLLTWEPSYRKTTCQATLNLSIEGGGSETELTAGLEPVENGTATEIAVGSIWPIQPLQLASNQGNAAFADHSNLLRIASPCSLSIALPDESGTRIAVHIRGQASRKIAIHSSARRSAPAWSTLTIGSGAIYNNGLLLTDRLGGKIQLLEMAAVAPSSFRGQGLIQGSR